MRDQPKQPRLQVAGSQKGLDVNETPYEEFSQGDCSVAIYLSK